jgi:hypothetical protein
VWNNVATGDFLQQLTNILMPTPVSEKELLPQIGITSRSLYELRRKKKIPFQKINSRLIIYDLDEVRAALAKYNSVAK